MLWRFFAETTPNQVRPADVLTYAHGIGRERQATLPVTIAVETVSAFLDHLSLAVTTTYLRRLEGVEDHSWERVAEAIGVEPSVSIQTSVLIQRMRGEPRP
jgi:hypothetical protein